MIPTNTVWKILINIKFKSGVQKPDLKLYSGSLGMYGRYSIDSVFPKIQLFILLWTWQKGKIHIKEITAAIV